MDVSSQDQKILLMIYIGQNVGEHGIPQLEINAKKQVQNLLSLGLIRKNRKYINYLSTTIKGSILGEKILLERINETRELLIKEINEIPRKVLSFFIKRHISKELSFFVEPLTSIDSWESVILHHDDIWIYWNKLFAVLEKLGLCVKTYSSISPHGRELLNLFYVISPEIQEFLTNLDGSSDFSPDQEDTLKLYPVLESQTFSIINDLEYEKQQFYRLLKENSVNEKKLAEFLKNTSEMKITSEYRGLLSQNKPFDILDQSRFNDYLDKKLIEPAVNILLTEDAQQDIAEETIEQVKESDSDLLKAKNELGLLDPDELGNFYVQLIDLEHRLRGFIKHKLGKGWLKRIENDIPEIVRSWKKRKYSDEKWGIEAENDLMNYADFGDYIQIIRRYNRMFSDGYADSSNIIFHLTLWYNHGRNPTMHARTVNRQKYDTAKSAANFLLNWMRRKRET